jgi:YLP motif-containing protein 1
MLERHNGFGQGFVPGESPHKKYFDGASHHYHQSNAEALPGALPLPPLPPYAEAANPYGSRAWHPEADAVPPPPEPPFPSQLDYRAAPPPATANSSLFPVLSSSSATGVIPPSAHTLLPQAHSMQDTNCFEGHIRDEVASVL